MEARSGAAFSRLAEVTGGAIAGAVVMETLVSSMMRYYEFGTFETHEGYDLIYAHCKEEILQRPMAMGLQEDSVYTPFQVAAFGKAANQHAGQFLVAYKEELLAAAAEGRLRG